MEMLNVGEGAIGSHAREIVPDEALYDRFRGITDTKEIVAIDPETIPAMETTGDRYYEVTVTPIESKEGELAGRIFVVDDVTGVEFVD
jgi:hypothetical protein